MRTKYWPEGKDSHTVIHFTRDWNVEGVELWSDLINRFVLIPRNEHSEALYEYCQCIIENTAEPEPDSLSIYKEYRDMR